MTIYTVIPFFSNGADIVQNEVKSFKEFRDAQNYIWNEINGKHYEIITNDLE
jgi:hypothetical protein